MTRGALRYTEQEYEAQCAKRARFGSAAEVVNTDSMDGGVESRHAPTHGQTQSCSLGADGSVQATAANAYGNRAQQAGLAPGPSTTSSRNRLVNAEEISKLPQPSIPSKYRNVKTNGYASKREAARAAELALMQAGGMIRNLREQVSYLLIPKQPGERACSWVADFTYEELAPVEGDAGHVEWRRVTEDCKGVRTDVYRIKKKLMRFVHQIAIRET